MRFSFLTPNWLFSCNTIITFQKYFCCSRFSQFDCKRKHQKFKLLFLLRRNVELYLLSSTNPEWETFFCCFLQMLLTVPMIEVSVVYLQRLCLVNLLACTIFENICLPFFLHKLISIYRQNWYCEEIPSSQNSDKAASLILLCSGKHYFKCIKKSGTVNHLTINQAVETPWSLFLFPSESSTLGCSCICIKFLLWNFGKTTNLQQRFCFASYSLPRCDSSWYWSNQVAWITKSNECVYT